MRNFEAISALAGAGKTYQLTTRYLALLARGASPESILAITFTRKAAGEIFDRIVGRLAHAILEPAHRERLQADLRIVLGKGDFVLTEPDLRAWLRRIIRAMPRLRIGTIDSLFVSMAQAFAFELGLPSSLEIMEGSLLALAQEEALDHALAKLQTDDRLANWLDEVFALITRRESKSVRAKLIELIREAHALYLEHPDEHLWGEVNRIWPRGAWWSDASDANGSVDPSDLLDVVAPENGSRSYRKAWKQAMDALQNGDWSSNGKLLLALLDRWHELVQSGGQITYSKKNYFVTAQVMKALRHLAAPAVREAIERLMARAQGAYRLAHVYEQTYQQRVRGAGQLSFQDVQHVLLRATESGVKLDIDYRLDGRFDHWMLDEFQDTSRRQWEIIRNLVDEILQSGSSDRSFFYVGDAKQAIYGWRGGDSTLFETIQQDYARVFPDEPTILNVCWRSSPIVLDAVNALFAPDHLRTLLPSFRNEIGRWERHWVVHEAAPKNRDLPGCVEVRVPPPQPEGSASRQADGVIPTTCALVKHLREQGVSSIAVLVRINAFGDKVADAIRAEGIPVMREVNPDLCDNGTISAFLSLCRFADHPGDTFSFEHIRMAGLMPALERLFEMHRASWNDAQSRDQLAARLREVAAAKGISGLCADVVHALFHDQGGRPNDQFIAIRLRQLMLVATHFDRLYRKGLSDFARYAVEAEVKDPVVTSGVVVMTVHKAKGLEFDAVILPDLAGTRREMTHLETGDLSFFEASEEEARAIGTQSGWILPLPPATLAQLDPVLKAFRQRAAHKRFYEELCLLYVATTRAKQALYFVIPEASDKETSDSVAEKDNPTPADLVRATFCTAQEDGWTDALHNAAGTVCYRRGDADWFKAAPKREDKTRLEGVAPFRPRAGARLVTRKRLMAGTPSGTEAFAAVSAEVLFDPARRRGAQRGTIVHELFQQIVWYTPDAAEEVAARYRAKAAAMSADVLDEAIEAFLRAMQSEDVQELLKRPSPRAEVWNEQAFEMAEGDRWITGRMDRIVIERNDRGEIISAHVVDFKTDRITSEEELQRHVAVYRPQMAWYAKAVATITGLPATAVRTLLLFTDIPKVVSVT